MTHEEHVTRQFVIAVTNAPTVQAVVVIDGLRYRTAELIGDMLDVSGHDYQDNLVEFLTSEARNGNEKARKLVADMGNTFAYLHCPPEPEPEELPELAYLDRGEYDGGTVRSTFNTFSREAS